MRLTWVGHSTVLIEMDGTRVLTDPLLRGRVGPLRRVGGDAPPEAARAIDAVLLSHLHGDHADAPSLRAAAAPVIAPRGAGAWLRAQGIREVTELAAGREAPAGSLTVRATPALHPGSRWPLTAAADAAGYVVAGSRGVYFAGDTAPFAAMADLAGTIDVALLPVWGWGPTLGRGHLDPRTAAEALRLIEPRVAVPVHWGSLHLAGLGGRIPGWVPSWRGDYMTEPPLEFARHAAELAPGVDVRVLAPGESLELP